jgi:hypothetical protein
MATAIHQRTEGTIMNAKVAAVTALISLSAALSGAAHANYIAPEIRSVLVEVCVNTQQDDRLALTQTFKANRLSKKAAVAKVVCNGQQLMDFARSANASKVVAMLTPYEADAKVSISDVVAP